MYAFCCKQGSLLSYGFALHSRISHIFELAFVQKSRILGYPIRYFSSETKSIKTLADQYSFTVSYLIESCGLSPQTAISASDRLCLKTPEIPDSVISLLRDHGFENTHICNLDTKFPKLLLSNPAKTLMPKFEFFHSIGLSNSELPKFLSSHPYILRCSLENRLVPICDFLKSIVGNDTKAADVLRRCWRIQVFDVQRQLIPNITLLRGLGAPQSIIVSLLSSHPNLLSLKTEQFDAKVKEMVSMGFNPSKLAFVRALAASARMSKSTWHHKVQIFKRWGCSDHEIDSAFKKNPMCFCLSETKIENGMDFLVNKMGVESASLARNPTVLTYNLEKRIIPRCLVVRFLQVKGLLMKDIHRNHFIQLTEKLFLHKFVTKYEEQVPQVLDLYQGKVDLLELGVRTEEIKWPTLM